MEIEKSLVIAYKPIQCHDQAISPDRQVYFFYSFKDTDREFRGRCAVYDVETKQLIAGELCCHFKF
jgi:hypothetical protein